MQVQRVRLALDLHVPDDDAAVVGARDEEPVVLDKGQAGDLVCVLEERVLERQGGVQVPDPHREVLEASGQEFEFEAEGQDCRFGRVGLSGLKCTLGVVVDQGDPAVVTADGEQGRVAGDVHADDFA